MTASSWVHVSGSMFSGIGSGIFSFAHGYSHANFYDSFRFIYYEWERLNENIKN